MTNNSALSTQHSALTAIVLAGGKSSRMGQDKALLCVDGVPLLQRVCHIAAACAETVYIVTPWPERYQNLTLPRCEFILEATVNQGPLVGFAQGLAQVQTDWVLLLACDLPKLQVEVLQGWIAELDNVGEDAIAALAHHTKGWEPLCGFYRRRCLPQLLDFINQGGRSFQQWLQQSSVQVLALPDTKMLLNCNTPEDWASL
ncbi:molybdopterin-guanine dinucleotide biosynthesis protein A [Nostoc piscinale CENA21]|uniref:Probable molybdenum cofactor guanylyltransferase n=1 Tax=Nostoc piscinale CENA21 TaxID=224013 RepID=A0A0M4SV49_9NOSO|nr:molybdenum cofactor guanylyltransferase [Nostoc piscinale]ALF55540.1 molybdopterin-guanine dinucleotide biosynthesis protein A [Nostoc piscinale CENA21]